MQLKMVGVSISTSLLVVLILASISNANEAEFQSFKEKFGKSYKTAIQEQYRAKVFANNLNTIAEHNKLHKAGKTSFTMGVNKFADLTASEMANLHRDFSQPTNYRQRNLFKPTREAVPDTIDWRDLGYVTGVKDEGTQCGSSYAFAATGSLEGQNFAKTGMLTSLSEQNLLDCSSNWENYGCSGGYMTSSYQYVVDNGGIDTEDSYPYLGTAGICRYKPNDVGGTATGYVEIETGDENALKEATGTFGPISVAVDASQSSFTMYSGGVYYEPLCTDNVIFAAMVAGYGTDNGDDYWLVKNCWGPTWGEQGYIRMARNRNNNCGIATMASYPTV